MYLYIYVYVCEGLWRCTHGKRGPSLGSPAPLHPLNIFRAVAKTIIIDHDHYIFSGKYEIRYYVHGGHVGVKKVSLIADGDFLHFVLLCSS